MRQWCGPVVVALFLALPSPALAQGHRPLAPGMSSTHGMSDSAAAMLDMLAERLELSAGQRVAAMPHVNAMHAAATEARTLQARWQADSTAPDGPSLERQIASARQRLQAGRTAFVELLSDEQRAAFEALHRHPVGGDTGTGRDHDAPPHDADHGSGPHGDHGV